MLLHLGVRAVQRVPRTAPPALEGHLVRGQRLAVLALHEPVGVLLEEVRPGLGNKRRHPDGGLEALLADGLEHALHIAAERRRRFPASRPWQADSRRRSGRTSAAARLLDRREIVHDVLRRDPRPEAIPTAPPRRRILELQRRMCSAMRDASFARSAGRLDPLVYKNSSISQLSPGPSASPSVSSTTSMDFGRRKKRPLKRRRS